MTRRRGCAPAVLSLGLVACAASAPMAPVGVPQGHGDVPRAEAPLSDMDKASRIEHAFLISERMMLGMREGIARRMAALADASRLTECIVGRMAPVTSDFAAQAVKDASTTEQLDRGVLLASGPFLAVVHRYALANLESLTAEGKASGRAVDEYLLSAAASRLGLPAGEQAAVAELVAWHQEIGKKQSVAMRSATPAYTATAARVGRECAAELRDGGTHVAAGAPSPRPSYRFTPSIASSTGLAPWMAVLCE
jgi:hypothetical protein